MSSSSFDEERSIRALNGEIGFPGESQDSSGCSNQAKSHAHGCQSNQSYIRVLTLAKILAYLGFALLWSCPTSTFQDRLWAPTRPRHDISTHGRAPVGARNTHFGSGHLSCLRRANRPPTADKFLLSRSDHLEPSIPDSRECGQVVGTFETLPGQIEEFPPSFGGRKMARRSGQVNYLDEVGSESICLQLLTSHPVSRLCGTESHVIREQPGILEGRRSIQLRIMMRKASGGISCMSSVSNSPNTKFDSLSKWAASIWPIASRHCGFSHWALTL